MKEAAILAVKAVIGGSFVVLFALVGEVVSPKRFAGLFSAAPSVAMAGLAIVLVTQSRRYAQAESVGMAVGSVAMVAACLAAIALVRRYRALEGSLLACVLWLAVAGAGYFALLR